jgi:hypothetical protein
VGVSTNAVLFYGYVWDDECEPEGSDIDDPAGAVVTVGCILPDGHHGRCAT